MSTYVSFSVENSDTDSDTTLTPNDESSSVTIGCQNYLKTYSHGQQHYESNYHASTLENNKFHSFDTRHIVKVKPELNLEFGQQFRREKILREKIMGEKYEEMSDEITDCKDGTHHDFARVLVERLYLLVEGLIDPRPSVFKEEAYFSEIYTTTAGNSPSEKDTVYEMGSWTPMNKAFQHRNPGHGSEESQNKLSCFGRNLTLNLNKDLGSLTKGLTPTVSKCQSKGMSRVPSWMQKLDKEGDEDSEIEDFDFDYEDVEDSYGEELTEINFSEPDFSEIDHSTLEENDIFENIRHRIHCDLE